MFYCQRCLRSHLQVQKSTQAASLGGVRAVFYQRLVNDTVYVLKKTVYCYESLSQSELYKV